MRDLLSRRGLFAVTAAISAFAIAYVAFTHVLAWSRRKVDDVSDFREGFGARDALPPSYEVRKKGALSVAIGGGVLAIEGGGKAGDEVVIATPARRFEDAVVSLKFLDPEDDAVEVFVGLEAADGARSTFSTYVGGATPMVVLGGDTSGPFRSMGAVEDVKLDAGAAEPELASDAGAIEAGAEADAGDSDAGAPPAAAPAAPPSPAPRLLAFQFTPMFGHAMALLDGKPVMSVHSGWLQATPARIVFGARLRKDTARVRVPIDTLALRTLDWTLPSFDDDFKGEFVDPQRYGIHFPDPDLGTLDVRMAKGGGVLLDGKATAVVSDHVPLMMLRTTPFPLRNLTVKADLTIEELDQAAVFFGLMGASAWTPANRVFDVGIAKKGTPKADVFVGGAWTTTGGLSFDPGPQVELPARVRIELRYDATTSKGMALVDGKPLADHWLDLKPLDFVAIRLGSDGYKAGARVKVRLNRIAVEQR